MQKISAKQKTWHPFRYYQHRFRLIAPNPIGAAVPVQAGTVFYFNRNCNTLLADDFLNLGGWSPN